MRITSDHTLYKLSATLCFISTILAVNVYMTRKDIQSVYKKISHLDKTIFNKERELSLLLSEWTHLNHPSHLHKINKHRIKLRSLSPHQIHNIDTDHAKI